MSFNDIFGWPRDYYPVRRSDGRIDLAQSNFEAEVFARALPFRKIVMERDAEPYGILKPRPLNANCRCLLVNMPGEVKVYRSCGKHTAMINPAAVDPLAWDEQGRLGGLCPDCNG